MSRVSVERRRVSSNERFTYLTGERLAVIRVTEGQFRGLKPRSGFDVLPCLSGNSPVVSMAVEDIASTGIDAPNLTELKRYGSRLLRWLILTVAAIGWVVFWGLVVRLHGQQGDIVSAAVVSVLFVLPAIIGYVSYLRSRLPGG